MEKILDTLKTPIQNYKESVELYRKNEDKDEIYYDECSHKGNSGGLFGCFILVLLIIVMFVTVFIQFWVLWFINSRKNKLSSNVFFLCILLWVFSWQIPLIPIIVIIFLVIFFQK